MRSRDRDSIPVLPFLRLNGARNGWRIYPTSVTFHIKLPFLGPLSKNIRFKDDTTQTHWNHPGPGWIESKRRKRKR